MQLRAAIASVLYLVGTLALLLGVGRMVHGEGPEVRALLVALVHLTLGFLLVRVLTRTLLGSTLHAIGVHLSRGFLRELAFGAGVGAAAVTLSFCVAWGAGGLQVTLGPSLASARSLSLESAAVVFASTFEEVMFRAGLTGALLLAFPRGIALAVPAAVFGLLHAMNPGASTLSVSNTMLAGLVLGLLFVRTRVSLAAPIGFHVAWNLLLGRVYGTAVSGMSTGKSLLDAEPMDILWSGGSYGVEAGVGTTIVLSLAAVALIAVSEAPRNEPPTQRSA